MNKLQIELKHKVVNGTFKITTDHFPIIIDISPCEQQSMSRTISFRQTKNMDVESEHIFVTVINKMEESDKTDFM